MCIVLLKNNFILYSLDYYSNLFFISQSIYQNNLSQFALQITTIFNS